MIDVVCRTLKPITIDALDKTLTVESHFFILLFLFIPYQLFDETLLLEVHLAMILIFRIDYYGIIVLGRSAANERDTELFTVNEMWLAVLSRL